MSEAENPTAHVVVITGPDDPQPPSMVIYCVVTLGHSEKYGSQKRLWGFETDIEVARRKVLENYTDLFEMNWYQHAVIETVPVGVPAWGDDGPLPTEWFQVTYHDGVPTVSACECPERYQRSCNFSMG